MLKNYFKVALRNLKKNKTYSIINISGLAVGMAATMIIGLWIYDELNYNKHFNHYDHIAQIYQHQTINGKVETGEAIPRPLEFALREDYNESFKHIVMASWNTPWYLKYKDKNLSIEGSFMQEGVVDMLNLNVIKGEQNGLVDKNAIMLAKSTAVRLFGAEDPIGKILNLSDEFDMKVSAVYEDIPQNNDFSDLGFIMPWKHYVTTREWIKVSKDYWMNNSFRCFVEIESNSTMSEVTDQIIDVKKIKAEDTAEFNPQIFLVPMKDWHLKSNFENGVKAGGRIENVWLFGIIGCFILLLACINFINLSTARSEKRATEVGIRKSIGSHRGQLILQFLTESFIVVFMAFVLATGLVLLCLPSFNDLAAKEISFPWANHWFWLASLFFILITALLAGSYPALYLSSFNPVAVLKGTFKAGRFSAAPRKVLVVIQFTVSIALIIGTVVVINQIQYSKNRSAGYDKELLVQIPVMSREFEAKADMMRERFLASGAVVEMCTTSSPTTSVWSNRSGFTWEGKPEGLQEDLAYTSVSYEFTEALGLNVIAGRGFSREYASDSNAVILNETAVKYMNLQNPIGTLIRSANADDENPDPPMKIIGVVEDFIVQSPYEPVKQSMYVFDADGNESYYNLRLNSEKSVGSNLTLIEQVFTTNFPNIPFSYQFIDEQFGAKFRAEERVASLARIFTILAIFISCLGLFGLASFVAEQRTKEIGVRKVLGASVQQLWVLLSKDFVILVLIALVIGSPLAYYMMTRWLQKFSYRTDISWSVFALAFVGAVTITLISVSYQAIRSATANPVKSLRTE